VAGTGRHLCASGRRSGARPAARPHARAHVLTGVVDAVNHSIPAAPAHRRGLRHRDPHDEAPKPFSIFPSRSSAIADEPVLVGDGDPLSPWHGFVVPRVPRAECSRV